MARVPESVSEYRRAYRASHIPRWYNGWLHLAFTSVGALSIIALAISRLHDVRPLEWITIPLAFLLANLAEYRGHKGPMHHPVRFMKILFERHTLQHHHFFTHEAMSYEGTRDFHMVLFPPVMLFFFLGVIATPIGVLLFLLTTHNVGFLFVATAMSYFLTYEWLHFAYHLDPSSFIGRLPLIGVLRRHHTAHHDLALMSKWNFNITFPICDWLFRTRAPRTAGGSRTRLRGPGPGRGVRARRDRG